MEGANTEHAAARFDADSLPTRSSLIHRLRDAGDDVSWRAFFETYWRLIYNVARKTGLSDQDAQDVVQETVIAVARKMPEFRYDATKGSFKQWLLLITRRRIQDRLRSLYRAHANEASCAAEALASAENESAAPDQQIVATWEAEWRDNVFRAALLRVRHQINPKHFQVFDCCVLQQIPPAKVARMLGLNVAQVYLAKHRVSVALRRAAAQVEQELDDKTW